MKESERGRRSVVALRHDRNEASAPRVVAKGSDETARRILELAKEHDVPVREYPDLLRLLAACEPGDEIPAELYTAVAGLLAYLYELNGELGERAA